MSWAYTNKARYSIANPLNLASHKCWSSTFKLAQQALITIWSCPTICKPNHLWHPVSFHRVQRNRIQGPSSSCLYIFAPRWKVFLARSACIRASNGPLKITIYPTRRNHRVRYDARRTDSGVVDSYVLGAKDWLSECSTINSKLGQRKATDIEYIEILPRTLQKTMCFGVIYYIRSTSS